MRSFSVFLALCLTFITTSYAWSGAEFSTLEARRQHHGNGTNSNGNSAGNACKQLSKLTKLTELAANQTKLDDLVAKGKLSATEVDELKTKAADATTKLQTLSANTTLTSECAVIDANKAVVKQCKQMQKLQNLVDIGSNQTAMDALVQRKGLNDTSKELLQEKIQKAETKLSEMQSNTTLTSLCTQKQQEKGQSTEDGAASATETPQQVASNSANSFALQNVPCVFILAFTIAFAFIV